jgi:hypothetical protein
MIHVKWLTNSKNTFIINDPLFYKGPRPLVTVSTAVITVLHSTEVVHFHNESCRPYARVNYSQNTSKVSRQENTMKSFEDSSNKLGPLDFTRQIDVEPPSKWHNNTKPIHMRTETALYPIRQAILTPKRNTTNKLEKGPSIWLNPEPL